MRNLLLASFMLLTPIAQAEVKEPGTFVPSYCSFSSSSGASPGIIAVQDVCLGSLVGSNQQVIQLILNDGEVREYEVTFHGQSRLPRSTFAGQVRTIRMVDNISGSLNFDRSTGTSIPLHITLETSHSNLEFSGDLEVVAVTQ